MKERRVALGDLELHLAEAGTGPPLLLLHGWPQHGRVWRPLVAELAREHRVLVPDLRGFGRSDAPAGDYRKHALAADVLALMDAEGIERAAIAGHDWGGWIAWLLALEHPQRVERFASLDIPAPTDSELSPAKLPKQLAFASYQYVISSPWLGEWLLRSSPGFVRWFIRVGSARRMRWSDEQLDAYAEPLREPARARASVALYRQFLLRELRELARGTYTKHELTVPGLVLMGERSAITRMIGLPRERPQLRIEMIPEAGHYLIDEAPDEVLAHLSGFLSAAPDDRVA